MTYFLEFSVYAFKKCWQMLLAYGVLVSLLSMTANPAARISLALVVIVLSFVTQLKTFLVLRDGDRSSRLRDNSALIWPFTWRSALVYLASSFVVLVIASLLQLVWMQLALPAPLKPLMIGAGLLFAAACSLAVLTLIGTWLPAIVYGAEAEFGKALERGRRDFTRLFILFLLAGAVLFVYALVFAFVVVFLKIMHVPQVVLELMRVGSTIVTMAFTLVTNSVILTAGYNSARREAIA